MNRPTLPWSQPRLLALLSVALALGAPLRTMYHLIDVVGSPTQFLLVASVALVAGAALAKVLRPWLAIGIGAVLFAVGIAWYMTNLRVDHSFGMLVTDTFALLMGRRLLQIANVRLWVVSYVSAPVFLTTYFAVRRWYVTAATVSGVTLGFFVLTTDAGVVTTLLGVVGGVAAFGFGRLDAVTDADRETVGSASEDDADFDSGRRSVLELLAAIILLPTLLSRVPGVSGSVLSLFDGTGDTIESSLVSAGESLSVQGSISLAPDVRFTVESEAPRYWRVGTYNRYTGDGWVRTGGSRAYDEGRSLPDPPGRTRRLDQHVEAASNIGTVPAAWKPVRFDGDPEVRVTQHEGLQPEDGLREGDEYDVTSRLLVTDPARFREAGDDYPPSVEDRYLGLPESTPDRVEETTTRLTANAENPYDTAAVIESWLQENREYSLEVSRPRRNVADRFLHAMDRGYCTYFATTMAVMLRTQDIPARLAVGYTPGENEGGNEWTVRGLHSHAWVEMYVPENGWVQFDPTPAGPREAAEQRQLDDDTGSGAQPNRETETPAETPTETPTETPAGPPTETPTETATESETPTETTGRTRTERNREFELPALPTREQTALGALALLGTAAGLRRAGVTERLSRAVWLRYQRPESPEADVERAFQRAMYVVGERHRQRRAGETVRDYLNAVDADEEVRRLARLRERLRYEGTVSSAAAERAIEIADEVVSER